MVDDADESTWIRVMGSASTDMGDLQATITHNEWRLERDGETILWGEGVCFIDLAGAQDRGYKLYEGDNVPWDEAGHEVWGIFTEGTVGEDGEVRDPDHNTGVGFPIGAAIGAVERKMIPAASPDVTALRLAPVEDLDPAAATDGGAVVEDHEVCPECGLQFSVQQPVEMSDGDFEDGLFLRACFNDGRVFMHSEGDVRGYPPEAFE